MTDIAADAAEAGEIAELVDETPTRGPDDGAFRVRLDNFEGPFDLLLNLISRRQLDVTEVALSQVTDEFISYLAAMQTWDLGKATEFLVVAATLLDLKTARLLPAAEVEDEEDLALLEARDLLFARLLQYRAYKLAAAYLARARPHAVAPLRPGRRARSRASPSLLPEVLIGVDPRAVRGARRGGHGAQAGAGGDDRPRARPARQRARAHRDPARPAAPRRLGHLPGAGQRLHRDHRGRRPVPGPARALPRRLGRLRPGRRAGRAAGALDRRATQPDGRRTTDVEEYE